MRNTLIEWCHHTVNFWLGCAKVSAACAHCYAEEIANRFHRSRVSWGPSGLRWLRLSAALGELRRLNASAERRGVRERVFINSMSDTFEDREDLHAARCLLLTSAEFFPALDLLLLTKRPENIRRMVPPEWLHGKWPANVWVGTTVEDQEQADRRLPHLIDCPAPVRFVSAEPLLGAVDLTRVDDDGVGHLDVLRGCAFCDGRNEPAPTRRIDWVICGGESGRSARAMHPDWARGLRDQCAATGVPFFFKQWGEHIPWEFDESEFNNVIYSQHGGELRHDDAPRDPCNLPKGWDAFWFEEGDLTLTQRVGKKAAGRLLDGIEHNDFPRPR